MKKSVIAFGILFSVVFNTVNANVNPNDRDKTVKTEKVAPISLAIAQNDYSTVKKFLESGADIEVKGNIMGMTPIMYAARYNKVSLIKLLIENGANIQEKSKLGLTAIEYAKHANAFEAVAYLNKISGNVASISLAISQNEFDTVKKFVEFGTDVNIENKINGMTPIMYAARFNNLKILRLLIANGADINKQSKLGICAIEYAKHANASDAVSYLKSL